MIIFLFLLIILIVWSLYNYIFRSGEIEESEVAMRKISSEERGLEETMDKNYIRGLRRIIHLKTEQEVFFMAAVAGAAGFFRPNKEKIEGYIERMERVYSDILLELEQRRDVLIAAKIKLEDEGTLEGFLAHSIKINRKWIDSIKLGAEQGDSSSIINFLSEIDHNMKGDKDLLERWLSELEKKDKK